MKLGEFYNAHSREREYQEYNEVEIQHKLRTGYRGEQLLCVEVIPQNSLVRSVYKTAVCPWVALPCIKDWINCQWQRGIYESKLKLLVIISQVRICFHHLWYSPRDVGHNVWGRRRSAFMSAFLLCGKNPRITEWFELEGTLEMWFQTPCHGQGHFPQTRWITGVVCALQAAWLKPKKVNIPFSQSSRGWNNTPKVLRDRAELCCSHCQSCLGVQG